MKDRRKGLVGNKGCSELWQGTGGISTFKDARPASSSARAKTRRRRAWGAGEIALGRPSSLLQRPCSQTDTTLDPQAVQSGVWMRAWNESDGSPLLSRESLPKVLMHASSRIAKRLPRHHHSPAGGSRPVEAENA
jgi:hypothetical protein